ncbi:MULTISPECIES: hypothetical protein [Agrobacterium]|uniref:Uncharacterized protein n=1 Tax=Agrobacterium tumefaciens TaxID=358 RepID=A0AAW8LQX9_AGRTU|nr:MULTISPECIES: hypothetical protein [Agrobacterium]MBP2564592.1 hypothetical protein [Agrobacterium tumefaciens]MDP9871578.1 hypothetical protein [Agrobacterium tumefaciens]MDP9976701.1 hypothetical protein [Agrobacterium tumefaciens]MDR6189191.1 hypothetical protein [Agrobacterium pusense]MDR6701543.1 hypothetical protein [Agrobacterium tumefaciens]
MSANDNLTNILNMPKRPITLERIEEMLLFAAKLVDERGPIMQPILDRLESEYIAAKQRGSATDRIRKLIQAA